MNKQLDDNQRARLDEIVHQMSLNKESDSSIQFVVNDFKDKYGAVQEEKPGFFKSIGQEVASGLTKLGATGADLLGQGLSKGADALGYKDFSKKLDTGLEKARKEGVDYGFLGKQTSLGQKGSFFENAKEAIGTGLKVGTMVAGAGTGSVASKIGLTGAKKVFGLAAENAVLGGSYQVGSNLEQGKKLTDNLGLSTALSAVVPIVGAGTASAKRAVLNKLAPEAERVINSLIKPLSKDFAYGKNPARGILNEGIIANNLDDLATKVSEKSTLVGEGIGRIGQTLDQAGVTLNLTPALTPIDEAIQAAAKNNNTTLFQSLNNVKTALMHELTPGVGEAGTPAIVKGGSKNLIGASYNEAKNFLSDISSHTKFTGNPSDDKALNMATKRAYGIARDIMNKSADSVDPNLGKQIRNLNERYADLLSAKSAISHRELVVKRQNFLNLADRFSIPVAIASSVGTALITGDYSKAGLVLVGQLATIGAVKSVGSTAAKTRIAQFLSRLAPEERQGILNSTPLLKNLYERMTGQTSPGINAPKTKSLQAVENYIKNPKVGLSVEKLGDFAVEAPLNKIPQTTINKIPSSIRQEAKDTYEIALDLDTGMNMEASQVRGEYMQKFQKGLVTKDDIKSLQETHFMIKGKGGEPAFNAVPASKIDPLIQEAKKYKSAEEFVKAQGKRQDYGIQHSISEGKPSSGLSNLDEIVKEHKVKNGYLTNYDLADLKKLKEMQGNPEADIKIYRASPVGELNSGDWVTTNKTYVNDIKKQNGGKVYEHTVKAKDLIYPNNLDELPSLARFSAFKYESGSTKSQLTDIWNKANKK